MALRPTSAQFLLDERRDERIDGAINLRRFGVEQIARRLAGGAQRRGKVVVSFMEWAGHHDGPHDLVEVIGSYRLADISGAMVFQLFLVWRYRQQPPQLLISPGAVFSLLLFLDVRVFA